MAEVAKDVSFNKIPVLVRQRYAVVRDVIAGDQALRAGEYLPYLNRLDTSEANVQRNAAYRQRAVWYPATSFTLQGLLGLAFRVDPQENLSGSKLEPMLTNVDGAGVSIYQQSQSALANVLQIGRHGLLVDWSEALGQPVIKSYTAESIINWRFAIEGGQAKLSMVVLQEEVEEEDGPWAVRNVTQWREIWLDDRGFCNVRIWRESLAPAAAGQARAPLQPVMMTDAMGNQSDTLVLRSQGRVLDFIPFTFIGSNSNDGNIDDSPLYGLAQVNLAHFRNSADFEDSVFFVGQVQPWITGLSEEWRDFLQNPYIVGPDGNRVYTGQRMYVGSRTPLMLPEGASFGFAQASPNTLVGDAMKQKEEQMIKIGARLIEATQAGKTATGENNDREATTSVLSMCVSNVNEAYQRALWFAAQFMDLGESFDTADAYKINQDFVQAAANPQVVAELVKSWQTGIIAKDDVRAYFRRLGLIATERSDEEIDSDLDREGPALGAMGDPLAGTDGDPTLAAQGARPGANGGNANGDGSGGGGMPPGNGNPDDAGDPGNAGGSGNRNVVPIRPGATQAEVTPIPNREPSQPPFDLQAIIAAIKAIPAPVINVEIPAPTVNVEGATITVTPPNVTVEAPNVTVEAPNVTVDSPVWPAITTQVEAPKNSPRKTGRLVKTANGYDLEVVSEEPKQ